MIKKIMLTFVMTLFTVSAQAEVFCSATCLAGRPDNAFGGRKFLVSGAGATQSEAYKQLVADCAAKLPIAIAEAHFSEVTRDYGVQLATSISGKRTYGSMETNVSFDVSAACTQQ